MWLKAISAAFKMSMEVFASLAIQWAVIAMKGRRLESDHRSDVNEIFPCAI
jgi:hypothetical protein